MKTKASEKKAKKGTADKAVDKRKRRSKVLPLILVLLILFAGILMKAACGSDLERIAIADMFGSEEYPDSLIALAERNPETMQFLLDYPEKKDIHAPIDISGEVVKGEIPLFLQWDERWGYESYGDDFLAVTGCGPTCLSMVYCGLTGDTRWNPYNLACEAQKQGYYVSGSGSSWSMMTELASKLGLEAGQVIYDEAHILAELKAGRPVICIMGPGDFTTGGHFIVLVGIAEDGNIVVNDPNSRINSEKTWELETLMSQMRNLWSYS